MYTSANVPAKASSCAEVFPKPVCFSKPVSKNENVSRNGANLLDVPFNTASRTNSKASAHSVSTSVATLLSTNPACALGTHKHASRSTVASVAPFAKAEAFAKTPRVFVGFGRFPWFAWFASFASFSSPPPSRPALVSVAPASTNDHTPAPVHSPLFALNHLWKAWSVRVGKGGCWPPAMARAAVLGVSFSRSQCATLAVANAKTSARRNATLMSFDITEARHAESPSTTVRSVTPATPHDDAHSTSGGTRSDVVFGVKIFSFVAKRGNHISRAPRTEHDDVLQLGGYARGGVDTHAYRPQPAAVRNDARFLRPRTTRTCRARRIRLTSCQTARASAHRAGHLDRPGTKARACSSRHANAQALGDGTKQRVYTCGRRSFSQGICSPQVRASLVYDFSCQSSVC